MKTTEQALRQVIRESIAAAPTVLQRAADALRDAASMGEVVPGDVGDVAGWLMSRPHLMPYPEEDAFSNAGEVMKAAGYNPSELDAY